MTSTSLQAVICKLREVVAPLTQDRYMAPDLETAAQLVLTRKLVSVISKVPLIDLGVAHAAG